MIAWIRQWFYMRRVLRGYRTVMRECRKINRILDELEKTR
jgi:hypothetical protein